MTGNGYERKRNDNCKIKPNSVAWTRAGLQDQAWVLVVRAALFFIFLSYRVMFR
jgi:hypothetical protein